MFISRKAQSLSQFNAQTRILFIWKAFQLESQQEMAKKQIGQAKLKYTRLFDTANFNSQIPLKLYESKCDAFVVASEENNVPVVSVHNLPREGHKGALLMELPNLVNQKKFNLEKQEGWSIQLSGLAVSLHTDLEAQPFQFQLRSPSHPRPDKKEYSTGAFSLNHAFAPAARKFRRGRMYSAQIFVD
ncbi:hypothetical protein T439DRAFT_117152 [Meredithblackwellia eburnea MCA 4105]